jgi:hypothetical protein
MENTMNETKHDGPAFPSTQYVSGISPTGHSVGMTLRDYFAAKAMQALAQKYSHEGDISRNAYKIADAMLRAREK